MKTIISFNKTKWALKYRAKYSSGFKVSKSYEKEKEPHPEK